ncbi:MAG: hypothetical protein ABW072_15145 [Sedimenticola sp.]
MKLKTVVLVPVVVAALAYGGIKGYIYYSVKGELDKAIEMASPFARISYGGISSDLGGKLTVRKIAVTPMASNLEMRIEAVEIEGDGVGFLLDLSKGLDGSDPPPKLSANIWGAEIPVTDDLGSGFSFGPGQQARKIAPKVCTLGGILQHIGLSDIGYSTLLADAGMGYTYDREGGDVALRFDYQVEGIESFAMDVSMRGVTSPGMVAMGVMPAFQNFEMAYRVEPDYMKRMVEHCAKKAGKSSQEYINTLFSQSDAYYAQNLGFIPGHSLELALKELVTKAGEVHIRAKPSPSLDPATLAMYKPEDIVRLLGLELSLNGRLITDLGFRMPTLAELTGSAKQVVPGEVDESEEPPKRVMHWRYVEVKRSELGSYLGSKARLYTSTDEDVPPKEGVLSSIRQNVLSIKQRVHGGEFIAHVELNSLVRAEVLIPQ